MPIIIDRLNRWRHSRGFGIHSPFAFRFVTEVLCQQLPYYAYARIGRDKRLRLLFRLIVEFQPERVSILSAQPELLERTVQFAIPRAIITDEAPAMLVIDAADTPADTCARLLAGGPHALILNASRKEAAAIKKAVPHGMTFDNQHGTIVVAAHRHLPLQHFTATFA